MPLTLFLEMVLLQIWRRRRLVLATFALLVGAAAAYLVIVPPKYTAETTLLAKFGREFSIRGVEGGGSVVPPSLVADDIVNSVIQIMGSQSLAEEIVSKIGVGTLYPDLVAHPPARITPEQAALLRFGKNLSIGQIKRSNVIGVEYTHTDPALAARALNLFVDAFQAKFLSLYADDSLVFLEASAKDLQAAFDQARGEIAALQAANPVFEQDGRAGTLAQRKSDLELQLAQLTACCSTSDGVARLRAQLAETDSQILQVQAAQNRLQDLLHRRDQLRARLDEAERRLEEAEFSQELNRSGVSSVSIVDRADVPAQTQKPSRTIRLILATLLAAVASLGLGVLVESVRRRFSSARELRTCFDVPVLAEIAHADPIEARADV